MTSAQTKNSVSCMAGALYCATVMLQAIAVPRDYGRSIVDEINYQWVGNEAVDNHMLFPMFWD